MAEYKRLISYIYAYTGAARERSVGFAKAEAREDKMSLGISVKGIYTDIPELYGVYLLFASNMIAEEKRHGIALYPLGNMMIQDGMGQYSEYLNPRNINDTGFSMDDILGLAIAKESDSYYRMFTLWKLDELNTEQTFYVAKNVQKQGMVSQDKLELQDKKVSQDTLELQDKETSQEKLDAIITTSSGNDEIEETVHVAAAEALMSEEVTPKEQKSETSMAQALPTETIMPEKEAEYEFVDIFEDDTFYDCMEVTPEDLKKLPFGEEMVRENSFLLHGYYQYHHLIYGKVRENAQHTTHFVGVPGLYCNREHFMASMFGFDNFKKSQRRDYTNPYFGYWYQEI